MRRRNCHGSFRLVEPLLRRVIFTQTGYALEVRDKWVQGCVAVVRRALEQQSNKLLLLGEAIGELCDNARLADGGLARNQDQPALAGLGLAPPAEQQGR